MPGKVNPRNGTNDAFTTNVERWSADDDAWRGYHRTSSGQVVLDDRNERVLSMLLERSGGTMLDVGCANGVLTQIFARKACVSNVLGIDGVDLGVPFPFTALDLDRTERLPFDDGSFDVVISLETIEHVHDTDRFARELHRVLKPDGYAIVSAPRIDGLVTIGMLAAGLQPPAIECSLRRRYGALGGADRVSGHVSHFTRRALLALLEENGFSVDAVAQAGIYTGWVHAVPNPPTHMRLPLWLLSKIPFKQDVTIARVRRRK